MNATSARSAPARKGRVIHLPRRVPARIRWMTLIVLVSIGVLYVVADAAIGHARDGLKVIGHDAGPQVAATGDLYYALSDMDAQVASILLMGRKQTPGDNREQAMRVYEQRRSEADRAALQAAELTADDPTGRRTVQNVLDGLGKFERLAAQALALDQQANHAPGPPPKRVLEVYRQATDLMRLELLPNAYNLTLDNGSIVRKTYEDKRDALRSGQLWVLLAAAAVLLLLLVLQGYLASRFRRLVNPALAVATLGVIVLSALTVGLLSSSADQLEEAKKDGFDSVLALSRTRAIGNSAQADQTRYLLDPERADTYEQVYLDKSQAILYTPAGNLEKYYAGLAAKPPGSFLGLLGEQRAPEAVAAYKKFQEDDRVMREALARKDLPGAIDIRVDAASTDFKAYDQAVAALGTKHRAKFEKAIKKGDDGLNGWNLLLPGAAIVLALIVIAGVQPRLSEYR